MSDRLRRLKIILRDNIVYVHLTELSAEELSAKLLGLSQTETVCILDSCGVGHLGSHLMIAGISPVEIVEVSDEYSDEVLAIFEEKLSSGLAGIFTITYDFGLKLQKITPLAKKFAAYPEPDIFLALFDVLVVHDYTTKETKLWGNADRFTEIEERLRNAEQNEQVNVLTRSRTITSNFTHSEYLGAVETVKEYIRNGDTYQANITQQITADLPTEITPQIIFSRLRKGHPAPFAAFIQRKKTTVVSASPERFFRVHAETAKGAMLYSPFATGSSDMKFRISASPIKGTRPRGKTPAEDASLRHELLASAKDRAENTMIVDLMRNDLGRVCEYGSVEVEKICEIEEHPTLFHLVSTVKGTLRHDIGIADIIQALFPCGSITGAPKIRTMQIIDEIETAPRGLSMGAIGVRVPGLKSQIPGEEVWIPGLGTLDLSVAIRTMVISENKAVFNVGGGIVIDSDPGMEYEESLLKAKALLNAIGA